MFKFFFSSLVVVGSFFSSLVVVGSFLAFFFSFFGF
jgi:hypothetical protein